MSPDSVLSPNARLRRVQGLGAPGPTRISERRQHRRYPFAAESQYILDGRREHAITTDISSGGAFLKTRAPLPVGKWIELLIDWPVLLDQRCPIRLVIYGRVLRNDTRGAAVRIVRYDFRLRSRSADLFVA